LSQLRRREGLGPRTSLDQGRPSFQDREPLPLRELPAQLGDPLVNATNSYLRLYTLGECTVIVTKDFGRWHLSVAHPGRYPNWDEIAEARYRVLPPDITVVMVLPPTSQPYVNIHPNCFQLIQIDPDALIPWERGGL
jgi:hypothetical protein